MTIKPGDRMPAGKFRVMGDKGPQDLSTADLFGGKRVVLFSVPGAFTPTCTAKHLPGYLGQAAQLRAKGIDTIACMAVNDVYVMNAWGKSANTGTAVQMLADGNGEYARSLGLELDARGFGMGVRGQRRLGWGEEWLLWREAAEEACEGLGVMHPAGLADGLHRASLLQDAWNLRWAGAPVAEYGVLQRARSAVARQCRVRQAYAAADWATVLEGTPSAPGSLLFAGFAPRGTALDARLP